MICVKDNFLDKKEFNKIKEVFFSENIPWSFGKVVPDLESSVSDIDNFQFSYTILPESPFYECLIPLFDKMNMDAHFRLKVNLNPRASKIFEHGYHTDLPIVSNTALFYLNTNDGYTAFETGTKVDSIENRLVIFDSFIKHTGTSCTNEKVRMVLNINYIS